MFLVRHKNRRQNCVKLFVNLLPIGITKINRIRLRMKSITKDTGIDVLKYSALPTRMFSAYKGKELNKQDFGVYLWVLYEKSFKCFCETLLEDKCSGQIQWH